MERQKKNEINECIAGIKKRDNASLIKLYSLVGHTVRAIALKYLKNEPDAEDLEQDFWAKIYDIADEFSYLGNGFSYLCKVITNMAINRYRQIYGEKKHIIEAIDYDDIHSFDESAVTENLDDIIAVRKALEKLTKIEKLVMQLVVFEDKTIVHIAKELGMSKSHVGRIKKEAEEKLKLFLSDYLGKK